MTKDVPGNSEIGFQPVAPKKSRASALLTRQDSRVGFHLNKQPTPEWEDKDIVIALGHERRDIVPRPSLRWRYSIHHTTQRLSLMLKWCRVAFHRFQSMRELQWIGSWAFPPNYTVYHIVCASVHFLGTFGARANLYARNMDLLRVL